jgi:hypothetical protein
MTKVVATLFLTCNFQQETVTHARGSANASQDVLRLLVHQWMLGKGPATIKWLMQTSGYTYPTVAKGVDQLGFYLKRDRGGVELKQFPRDEWVRLLAVSDAARQTVRFTDRSGQPLTTILIWTWLETPGLISRCTAERPTPTTISSGAWIPGWSRRRAGTKPRHS